MLLLIIRILYKEEQVRLKSEKWGGINEFNSENLILSIFDFPSYIIHAQVKSTKNYSIFCSFLIYI